MPKGTTKTRFDNIAKEGATVTIEEVNYDDCVRMAAAEAAKTEHGIIVQDTAWEGYEEIPSWIMQGYGTMVMEADQQLREDGAGRPTHVFVQAGVGSLAGAVVGYFANKYKDNPPIMAVCEASAADCLYRSAVKKTGELVNVSGDLNTIMAGLHDEDARDLKEALKLDENSNILVISTEGDTDPVRYREIVWDGLYGTDKSLSK